MTQRVAIDKKASIVDLCRWHGAALVVRRMPADSSWRDRLSSIGVDGEFDLVYRWEDAGFDGHSPASMSFDQDARALGARRIRGIPVRGSVDPGLVAARQAADRLGWAGFLAIEAGDGRTILTCADSRGTRRTERVRWGPDGQGWFDDTVRALRDMLKQEAAAGSASAAGMPLVCYGEAAPGVAAELAAECGSTLVAIPVHAASLPAVGLLICDEVAEAVERSNDVPLSLAYLRPAFGRLMDAVASEVFRRGFDLDDAECRRFIELAAINDGESVEFECPGLSDLDPIAGRFKHIYEKRHASPPADAAPVVRSIRIEAVIETPKPRLPAPLLPIGPPGVMDGPLRERHRLSAGSVVCGPAAISDEATQLVIPPGWAARVWDSGDLVMTRRGS